MLGVSRLLTGRVGSGDALRYGRETSKLPAHLLHYSQDKKPVVVWTSTRRCNLHCAHCYTDSDDRAYPGELSTHEALEMIKQLADFGVPVLLISGGEPLRRPDLVVTTTYAVARGMRVVLSTNGTLMTPALAQSLAAAGLSYVGISIDGPPEVHNKFRGARGAFERSMEAVQICRDAGIGCGLRFTLTRQNQEYLPWLFDTMEEYEISRLCMYHLAPTGRGARIQTFVPSVDETRSAMDFVFERVEAMEARGVRTEVLTADNHADAAYLWLRLAREHPDRADDAWQLLEWNGGNQSGEAIACVDMDGTVYADQFWRWRSVGNLRERDFASIWREQPESLLRDLRARRDRLPGRCRNCRFLPLCNGNFRSRAEAVTGDLWGMDPLCYLRDEEVAREQL